MSKRYAIAAALILMTPAAVQANDWEKFYQRHQTPPNAQVWAGEPELRQAGADFVATEERMWQDGYCLIGYSSFNSSNAKSADAVRFAKKLGARYVFVMTELTSSSTINMPLTTPTTSTSYTSGNATAYGNGGMATGTYNGTTTTYGSQTTYIPIVKNRYDKIGLYFVPLTHEGIGALTRLFNQQEIQRYETAKGFVIRAIRAGSPAYQADLLPGDVVLKVNGLPAADAWNPAFLAGSPMKLSIIRNGTPRELVMPIPADWRRKEG